jgi:hypothetical protein
MPDRVVPSASPGPNDQVHVLDAGHFALDTAADGIAPLVPGFVSSAR